MSTRRSAALHAVSLPFFAGGLLALIACNGVATGVREQTPVAVGQPQPELLDLATLSASPRTYHDQVVLVDGLVTSVCEQEGCFLNLVPLSGRGTGVFVAAKLDGPKFPKDCVGKIARVKGRFFSKVYPHLRMSHWHGHGWRAREAQIFPFAEVLRIDAEWATFRRSDREVQIEQVPLTPYASPVVDLRWTEIEAALMGARKQCLDPGEETPSRSTRRYHELILALDQPLIVKREAAPPERGLRKDQAYYLPARTVYRVKNAGIKRGCFIMVYSLPGKTAHSH